MWAGVCSAIASHFQFRFQKLHEFNFTFPNTLGGGQHMSNSRLLAKELDSQGLPETLHTATLLRALTFCLDMPEVTRGSCLHIGSKSEKNIPGLEAVTWHAPTHSKHEITWGDSSHTAQARALPADGQEAPSAVCLP